MENSAIFQQSTSSSKSDEQISFEIPTNRDLQHIENLHKQQKQQKYSRLLGNVAYDTLSIRDHVTVPSHVPPMRVATPTLPPKTLVLNLSDMRQDANVINMNRMLFGDADMQTIINILWIGVVSALVILSIIFIVLSVYFYRKFRVWKKCNRESYAHNSTDCCAVSDTTNDISFGTANITEWSTAGGAVLCNIPPPCYAIATGLPTYAEALNRQLYGNKFLYAASTTLPQHLFVLPQPTTQQYETTATARHESLKMKSAIEKNDENLQQFSDKTHGTVQFIKHTNIAHESNGELTEVVVPLLDQAPTIYEKNAPNDFLV